MRISFFAILLLLPSILFCQGIKTGFGKDIDWSHFLPGPAYERELDYLSRETVYFVNSNFTTLEKQWNIKVIFMFASNAVTENPSNSILQAAVKKVKVNYNMAWLEVIIFSLDKEGVQLTFYQTDEKLLSVERFKAIDSNFMAGQGSLSLSVRASNLCMELKRELEKGNHLSDWDKFIALFQYYAMQIIGFLQVPLWIIIGLAVVVIVVVALWKAFRVHPVFIVVLAALIILTVFKVIPDYLGTPLCVLTGIIAFAASFLQNRSNWDK